MKTWGPWILAAFAVGLVTGARAFSDDPMPTVDAAGMSRDALDSYVRDSFVQILDRSFQETGVFDRLRGSEPVDILLVSPNCVPSAQAIDSVRHRSPPGREVVLVSAAEDEAWITASHPDFPIADPIIAEQIRELIPIRVGPTLIQIRFRTVVGFRLGLTSVLQGLEPG